MAIVQDTEQTTPILDHYIEEFERSIQDAAGSPLVELRRAAMRRFLEIGFPHRRDEEWRFTDIRSITDLPYSLAPYEVGTERPAVDPASLGPAYFAELTGHRLVFVNGRFAPELSKIEELPAGVLIGSIAQVLQSDPELALRLLSVPPVWGVNAFSLLNEAFLEDGAFIFLPRNAVVEVPVVLVNIANPDASVDTVSHPRTLVIAEANSQMTLVESYIGLPGKRGQASPTRSPISLWTRTHRSTTTR